MSEVVIRPTDPEKDGPAIEENLMEPGVLRYFPMCNLREVKDSVSIWLQNAKKGYAFTAELDGKPVGMMQLYINPYAKLNHQCLFSIVIDVNHRGQGIGTKLLNYVFDIAKTKFNIEQIHLEVYEGNPAKRLYDRLGFQEYGRHTNFLKEADGSYATKIHMLKYL